MPANSAIRITELDFDTIKSNLKTFLRSQSEFQDYDFEASAMANLIDLLAYNTYYNQYYVHMALNEKFIHSAQLRNNVVSRARELGYTPSSARGARATVQVVIAPGGSPTSISISRDTQFQTSIDGINYTFVTDATKVINANALGVYNTNLEIVEGIPLTQRWTVDTGSNQKYVIPNDNVDTSSFRVYVQDSSSNSQLTTFVQADDITQVNATAAVFFLQESTDARYELIFGNGVIGKPLNTGNILQVRYRVCNGDATNGANSFSAVSTVGGYSSVTVNLVDAASGGVEAESIDSIRFNAPKNFETQNRAVVSEDYRRIVLDNNPDIAAINVWGGQENIPPVYGKVFISAKPSVGNLLSSTRKEEIIKQLKAKNIMTAEPEFVDPTFLYVMPDITVRYDPTTSTMTAAQISNLIEEAVVSYEDLNLKKFGKDFVYQDLMEYVRNADSAIVSSLIDVKMCKQFIPNRTQNATYRLSFNNAVKRDYIGHQYQLSSSSFPYAGRTVYLDDDGYGNVRIYYLDGTTRKYIGGNIGTVDYITGLVTLNDVLLPTVSGTELKIKLVPLVNDVTTFRNQLILLSDVTIRVYNDATGQLESYIVSSATTGATESLLENGINTVVI